MMQNNIDQMMQTASEHHQAGRSEQAEQLYRQVLGQQPDHSTATHCLGLISHQSGQLDEAVAAYRRAIALRPDYAEAHNNLGNALTDKGQLDEAVAAYRQAIAHHPNLSDAHYNLGIALADLGRLDEAITVYRQAIALRPNDAEAHNNLGNALTDKGQLDEAIAAYREVISLRPDYAEAYNNLGNSLTDRGRLDEAIAAYRRAIALRPDDAEAYNNLGNALTANGQLDEAIVACRYAVSLNANLPEAYSNLGNAWKHRGRPDEAIAAYRQAIALQPNFAEVRGNLGNALKDQGQLDDALASYKDAMALKPASAELHNCAVYAVCFHPKYGPLQILEEARAWARQHADPFAIHVQPHYNDRSPDRPLRVGYVSPNFRDHVVGRNILPILENHDRQQFEISCFSNLKVPDALTRQFREIADHWHDTAGVSDEDLANLVRHERIDILVDLTLHMAGSRLLTFARKPAPVQVTWAGYPGTTGLSAIDYRLTDHYLDPLDSAGGQSLPGQGDKFYSEKSIRLPHSFWCFRPAPATPEVNPLPALSNGFVIFGCLNNFCKVTDLALDLWVQVLQAVHNSRLLILSPYGDHRDQVLRRFQAGGVDPQRIEFVNHLPFAEYIRRYHLIDIGLDPLPYTGHSTSLDAFWMGVPVVTLAGVTVASRGGVSIASNLGMPELVATTAEQYVGIAARLASDLKRLSKLRSTLRQRLRNSPLMDERRFTLDIEGAYRQMWRNWCSTTS